MRHHWDLKDTQYFGCLCDNRQVVQILTHGYYCIRLTIFIYRILQHINTLMNMLSSKDNRIKTELCDNKHSIKNINYSSSWHGYDVFVIAIYIKSRNNCDIILFQTAFMSMLQLAIIGIIYVNLLDSKIYFRSPSIILKLWSLMLTPCNMMFKIAEVLLSSVLLCNIPNKSSLGPLCIQ